MKKNKKAVALNNAKSIGILIFVWGIGLVVLLGAFAFSKGRREVSRIALDNANAHMNIYSIDADGSAVLLESRGNFILMNTGSKDKRDDVLSFVSSKIAKSKASGKYKTFSLYISEIEDSYIGEVEDVFDSLPVDSLYIQDEAVITQMQDDSKEYRKVIDDYRNIISLADDEGSEIVQVFPDYEIVFGDAKITILGVDLTKEEYQNNLKGYINDSSLISLVTVGNTKYLSTGSISDKVEKKLVNKYEGNLQADLYTLGNYGNENSSSAEFLKYVDPDYSFALYNEDNNARTDAAFRTMYYGVYASTKENGNIHVSIRNDDISLKLDKNAIRMKVAYRTDRGEKLSGKVYQIARNNTLSNNWDFFVKDFEGYKKERINYGISLANVDSTKYGVLAFKGIEELNKTVKIDIIYSEILVDSVKLNSNEIKIDVGDTHSLTATVEPYNAKVSEYIWESDNKKVATVKDGIITGISKGKATITVRMKNSAVKDTCVVYVGDFDYSMDGLSLNTKKIVLDKSIILDLNNFENSDILWTVANNKVLEIDSANRIRPLRNGTTVIIGTLNGFTDKLRISITDGLIVTGVAEQTTVEKFLDDSKLKDSKVMNTSGKYKNNNENVFTNDVLITNEEKSISAYTISVLGDVNGDGAIEDGDISVLNNYLKGDLKLSKASLKSADVNADGKVNTKDVRVLHNYLKHRKGYETLPYKD